MKNPYETRSTAERYDFARSLPAETQAVWLAALTSAIPKSQIKQVMDLGCGTGRFSSALSEAFECPVIGVEPSEAMLSVARSRGATESDLEIDWKLGRAEDLPLEDSAVDLVFMSQVFHHLIDRQQALSEISRVLSPRGYLAIRNGVREENDKLAWLNFFPEARIIEDKRTPTREELRESIAGRSFSLVTSRTIQQLFANSYDEYFQKISRRGLSSLVAISDQSFLDGLARFHDWTSTQPHDVAVHEPMDLFVFQRNLPKFV